MQEFFHRHLPLPYEVMHLRNREPRWERPEHTDPVFQLIVVTQGQLLLIHDGIEHYLRKAHVCLIPPNQLHHLQTEHGYQQLGINLTEQDDERGILALLRKQIRSFVVWERPDLLPLISELMIKSQHPFHILSQLNIARILDTILLTCLEQMETEYSFQNKLVALLEDHLAEPLPLQEIAQQMSFSKAQLQRVTQQQFGCSVMELLRRIRLQKACSLILYSDLSIDIIAETLGFFDQAHFQHFFRQRMGMTPLQFRKSHL